MDIRRSGFFTPPGEEPEGFRDFLTGDAKADAGNMAALLRTIAALNSNLDLDSLVIEVVDRALDFTGAERGILLTVETGELRIRVARDRFRRPLPEGFEYSRSIPDRVAREGRPVLEAAFPSHSMLEQGLRTVMCAPLRVKNRTIGVLYVDSMAETRGPEAPGLGLLSALACQVAISLDNARLLEHYAEKLRIQAENQRILAEQERVRQELNLARDIQRRFLPEGPLALPGFDIHGLSVGCEETSGDYFDYIRAREGRVGLVVGDVAGHGVSAALFMATARALLRSLLLVDADPAAALGNLNAFLCDDMEAGRFMTLFYGDLDVASRTLHGVRAGHNPPLLYRRGSDAFEELRGPGVALGMVRGFRYRAAEPVSLGPGDLLFLYTDGIIEAMDPAREPFGTGRAAELLRRHRDLPARGICDALRAAVDGFRGGAPQEDDLTMIVAKAAS